MIRPLQHPFPLQTVPVSTVGPLLVPDGESQGFDGLPPLCLHHQAICGVDAAKGRAWFEFLVRGTGGSGQRTAMELVRVGYARRGAGFDLAVLDRALFLGRALHRDTRLGVNIHPASLHDPAFTRHVLQRVAQQERLADRLILELVEFQGAVDLERCRTALQRLQRAGIRIALDDFGPGSPNLDLIASGLIDVLKLDRSLVTGLDRAPRQLQVISGLVGLAGRTGMELVAEGVETVAQFDQLRRIGVRWMQGHLFGRPGPVRATAAKNCPTACPPRHDACTTPNRPKEIHA
jgi:EAL domain-containing protein (putative c-di-GMP-specific phosphodiesterase class I)